MVRGKSEKAYRGMGMEGWIAKWYAAMTRKSEEEYRTLTKRVAAGLRPGAGVLEVAPGPGYFCIELAKLGDYRITGIDISRTFVEIAQRNAAAAGVEVDFRLGNASGLPLESDTFDFVLCRAAFKNFSNPTGALREMWRVLRPGGRALILDLRRDASWNEIKRAVGGMKLGWLNAAITRLIFRFLLLKRAYVREEVEQFVSQTKFRTAEIREELIGLEARLKK